VKFFWRLKKDDTAGSEPAPASSDAVGTEAAAAAQDAPAPESVSITDVAQESTAEVESAPAGEAASNVVTLQPGRLSERIAAAALKTVTSLTASEPVSLVTETVTPRAPGPLPGHEAAYQNLLRVLSADQPRAHVLVTGRAGSGRRTAVQYCVMQAQPSRARPSDWVYVASHDGSRLTPYRLPHGQAVMFAAEANAAAGRARISHQRLVASDDYRLGLEIIDEEYRQRASKMLDVLKRRAEEQNIALVKTPEGFVLAPMHDGKVVRNDVFRALPEGMQREVEVKISGLESDLKGFLELLPEEDNAQSARIEAFSRDAAVRAIRPHTDALRAAFTEGAILLDAVQEALVTAASSSLGARASAAVAAGQVLIAQASSDFATAAPAIFAHDASPAGLCGEVGHDASGRLMLKPGALMQANGGYLVVEAWRLAADPQGWAALARALELGHVSPLASPGVEAEPIAFSARIVLIADEHALTRLLSIDSGIRRFFRHIVRLPSSVPRDVMTVAEYAALAAAIADAEGLRPIAANASDAIYRAALARDGGGDMLPLDTHGLRALLLDADLEAAAVDAAHIRQVDVEAAARRAAELSVT
jgi:hypothetical protein